VIEEGWIPLPHNYVVDETRIEPDAQQALLKPPEKAVPWVQCPKCPRIGKRGDMHECGAFEGDFYPTVKAVQTPALNQPAVQITLLAPAMFEDLQRRIAALEAALIDRSKHPWWKLW
jgi:hypothetical protein